MKSVLGQYMNWKTEVFFREHLDLLDFNLSELYEKANLYLLNTDIGELTSFLYKQNIDPLQQMNKVPKNYLGAEYSRYIDPIPNLIPPNIKIIGKGSFQKLWWEDITIPSNVQEIEAGAFREAYVHKITLNEGLKEIGNAAFMYCDNLEEIVIPDSVEFLGGNCFAFTGLKKLYIGSGVKNLCDSQFDCCLKLEDVTYNGTIEQLKLLTKNNNIICPRFFPDCPKLKYIKCNDGDYEIVEKY